MEHHVAFVPSGTVAAVHAPGADVVAIRGKASGRDLKVGDVVTPEDGDLVVTMSGRSPVVQGCVTVGGVAL